MSVAGRDNLVDSIATAFANSRPTPFMVGWSRPSRTWLRAKRWMETHRCGTSPYCGMARAPTDCPRPTSNFWRASITCSEQVGLIDLCSGDGTRFAVWMMLYPCSLMLVRRAAVTATLYALIVMLMVPTRAPTMEPRVTAVCRCAALVCSCAVAISRFAELMVAQTVTRAASTAKKPVISVCQ